MSPCGWQDECLVGFEFHSSTSLRQLLIAMSNQNIRTVIGKNFFLGEQSMLTNAHFLVHEYHIQNLTSS